MAEWTHWWIERWLRLWVSYSLSLSPARLFPIVSICLFLFACLFVHPFLWWSMAFSVYLGLSLSFPIYPSSIIDVSCCPSICPFIYLSLILRFHLSIQLSAIHFFLSILIHFARFCETSSLFECDTFKNEAILRDVRRKRKVECNPNGLVPTLFTTFPLHVSKVLHMPRIYTWKQII